MPLIKNQEEQIFSKPIGDISRISGYTIPLSFSIQDKENLASLEKLAGKILEDPLLKNQLSDRIYELLLEDIRLQKERSQNYGGRFYG